MSWWRSRQARYLLALHDLGSLRLTADERLLCLRLLQASYERTRMQRAEIQRLARLIRTHHLQPHATRSRSRHQGDPP